MRISLFAVCVLGCTVLTNVSTAFAQPAPQLTKEGLVNSLAVPVTPGPGTSKSSETTLPGDCDRGFEKGDSGECEPLKAGDLGFNLGAIGANPGTAPKDNALPSPGVRPLPNAGPAQPLVPVSVPARAADLLLTFQLNSAELTEQGKVNAGVFVAALSDPRLAGSRFEIEGHTDASGSRSLNLALSQRRAEAVKQFLVTHGIDAGRLTTVGYGFDRLADASNPLSAENRRVVARRIQ